MALEMPLHTQRQFRVHNRLVWFVKVSHHGRWHERWRPLARVLAEKHGPIPEGHLVNHRDCDPTNPNPETLVYPRANHFKILLQDKQVAKRQKRRRARSLRKKNAIRNTARKGSIRPHCWYAVIHGIPNTAKVAETLKTRERRRVKPRGLIVMIHCKTKREAIEVSQREEFAGVQAGVAMGKWIHSDPDVIAQLLGYTRYVPFEGQAWVQKRTRDASTQSPDPADQALPGVIQAGSRPEIEPPLHNFPGDPPIYG